MTLPKFEQADLINKISILTNQFEFLTIPNSHVKLINGIPVEHHTNVAGLYIQFYLAGDTLQFINSNQKVLYDTFNFCEITKYNILCYGVKNND